MSNPKVHRGAHKYLRVKHGTSHVWRCVLGCPHFLYREQMIGRMAVCWRCGGEFLIGKKEINKGRTVKPHCRACTKTKRDTKLEQALLPEESPI